jgi:hypothetical protein
LPPLAVAHDDILDKEFAKHGGANLTCIGARSFGNASSALRGESSASRRGAPRVRSAVKGGAMTISTELTSSTSRRKASRKFCVSATVIFIFQFAAMIFLRMRDMGGW